VTPFNSAELEEGAVGHFEAKLEPTDDGDLTLQWTLDGKPLAESSRFKKFHAFGMVIFEIMGVRKSDEGKYCCTAKNKLGTDTATFQLQQLKTANKLAPKFITQIKDIAGLRDGMSAHFEGRVTPSDDAQLRVEWKFNGQPLPNSSRIKTVSDFGFVMLDIAGVDSRDSGEYICTAINKFGSDTTRAVLRCEGSSGVLTQSLHPDALPKLATLELGTGHAQHQTQSNKQCISSLWSQSLTNTILPITVLVAVN
jgi:hypothetical protein